MQRTTKEKAIEAGKEIRICKMCPYIIAAQKEYHKLAMLVNRKFGGIAGVTCGVNGYNEKEADEYYKRIGLDIETGLPMAKNIRPMGPWIERVRELAHMYKEGLIPCKIRLVETQMKENEDSAKALEEYATIMERLIECRNHMIPHRHDTEIIDYILTGEKNEHYTKIR